MPKIERVTSGIKGLDKLIEGGFVKGSTILMSGSTGTGKSIMMLQFCWEGLQNGENALYISLEENPNDLKRDALQFGWDFSKYEKTKKFKIDYIDPSELVNMNVRLQNIVKEGKFSRIAIDSSSLIEMCEPDECKSRNRLFKLFGDLKSTGATVVVSAEVPEDTKSLSRYGFEEFIVDGVIVLYYTGIGEGIYRNVTVRKMRLTDHDHGLYPMIIGKNGITVKSAS